MKQRGATVRSPNPVAKGAMVPLAASFLLSAKPGREAWLAPQIDPAAGTYSFDVRVSGTKAQLDTARQGTKTARGANFSCILTSTPISGDYIKAEGVAGRLGVRLLAIVAEGERGRIYLPPTAEMETVASNAQSTWQPEQGLPDDLRNIWVTIYGFKAFGDLFTPRQAVALTTFADLVDEARARIVEDSAAAELPDDPRPLAEGGTGANAYADAVATYLALCIGRCADFWSSLATWSSAPKNELVVATFRRQALPMTWDFGEVNPFSDSGGNFTGNLRLVAKALDAIETSAPGVVIQSNAQKNAIRTGVFYSSDPPYYDNIGYADLSDFFYVWLRRAAGRIYPALFGTLLTPKTEELIASPYRHGGREAAERFFLAGMQGVMRRMAEAATPEAPITLYYAFKQSETNDEGVASTGWATFLQAVHEAGLIVDGTWPIRTERAARSISIGTNALASSIVLVCRRRAPDAPAIARGAFLAALRRELPPAARLLRASGIAATDFEQAIIGPGMEVFTRHRAVLDSDDTAMPVKTALALINQVLDEDEADVDAATRFALTWFATHGFDERPYGDADNLARARDVGVDAMTQVGLLVSGRGRVRLKRRDEWPDGFDAAVSLAADAPAWMMANALAHALDTGGEATAGALLGRLGARAEPARDLAYRVFLLSERKKLAAEAGVWNALAVAWPDLIDRAREAAERAAPAQAALAI